MGVCSVHLKQTGIAASGYAIPASVLDGDWSIAVAIRGQEYDSTSHPFLSLVDSTGRTRFSLGQNNSPWYTVELGTGASTTVATNLSAGSPPKGVYDDLIVTYKAPTAGEAGYFRLYLNGSLTGINSTIPAGSNAWTGTDCRLLVGGATLAQDFYAAEVRMWTSAIDSDLVDGVSDQIGALSNKRLADLSDVAGQKATLYWYGSFSDASPAGTLSQEAGTSAVGALTLSGVYTPSSTVPKTGWTYPLPADTTPPSGGSVSATVVSDTSISVDVTASTGVVTRKLYVSRGKNDYRYTASYSATLAGTGNVTGHVVSSVVQGTHYWVTVEEFDGQENMGLLQTEVTTTGVAEDVSGITPKSLRFTSGMAITSTYERLPVNRDWTVKLHVKRLSTDGAGRRHLFRQDAYSGGYSHLLVYSSGIYPVIVTTEGETNREVQSSAPMVADVWECWFFQFKHPTVTETGYLRIYKRVDGVVTKVAERLFPMITGRSTDLYYRKHPFKFVLGSPWSTILTSDWLFQDAAWWTEILTEEQMGALSTKAVYRLTREERMDDSLYWYVAPTEAAGTVAATLGNHRGAIDLTATFGSGVAWSTDTTALDGSTGGTAVVADRLAVATAPANAVEGSVFGTQPVIRAVNAQGLVQTDYAGTCTVAVQSGSGTLSGTTTVNFASGTATFTNLVLSADGAYTLAFTSGGLTPVTANLTVTATPDTPPVGTGPETLTADMIEPTKVRLTWPTAATSIDTYYGIFLEGQSTPLVDMISNHEPTPKPPIVEWMTQVRLIVGELTPGQTYRFVVKTKSGGTWNKLGPGVATAPPFRTYVGGGWSEPSPVCEVTMPAAVPHQPLNAHIVDKASLSVTLRCAHSDDPKAQGTATKYGLFSKLATDAVWSPTPVVDNLQPEAALIGAFVTVTYVPPTTAAYDYVFKAYNTNGWSEPSNTLRITADGGPIDVATFAGFKSAITAARPGDIIRCTQPMIMDTANTATNNGIVIDFGGLTHTYTGTVAAGATNRLFLGKPEYAAYGLQFRNGTILKSASLTGIDVSGMVVLAGGDGVTVWDVELLDGFYGFFKMDLQYGNGPNKHLGIYNTRVEPQSRTTVVDIGPQTCHHGVIWGHTHYQAVNTGMDTAADGIANELGYGFWDIRDCTIDGVNGDGIDLKFMGDYYLKNLTVKRTARNSLKVWGLPSSRGTVDRPRIIACGKSASFGAGNLTVNDGLFEGYGEVVATGFNEDAAVNWGGGRMENGNTGYGGLNGVFNRCNFRRRMSGLTVVDVSNLTFTDGGDSNPLEPGGSSTLQFNDCLWYSAGTHDGILVPKVVGGNVIQYDPQPIALVTKSQASAGVFPIANHSNSRWLDEDWSEMPVNVPPTVSATGDATGTIGVVVNGTYTAADADGDTLAISGSVAGPTGSTATLNRGTGTWAFTPNVVGAYTVTITVSDNINPPVSDTHTVNVTQAPEQNTAPEATVTSATASDTANPFLLEGTATDVDGDVLTVTVTFAVKPLASTLTNTDITYDFAPTTGAVTAGFLPDIAGDYALVITASDGLETVTATTETLTIAPYAPPEAGLGDTTYTFEVRVNGTLTNILTSPNWVQAYKLSDRSAITLGNLPVLARYPAATGLYYFVYNAEAPADATHFGDFVGVIDTHSTGTDPNERYLLVEVTQVNSRVKRLDARISDVPTTVWGRAARTITGTTDNAITAASLQDGSLTNAKLADGVLSATKFATNALGANAINSDVAAELISQGLATQASVDTVSGRIGNFSYLVDPNNSILGYLEAVMRYDAATPSQLSTATYIPGSHSLEALNEGVTPITNKVAGMTVSAGHVLASLDAPVTITGLPDGAITAAKIADGALTATKIADAAITAAKLAANAITNTTLANGAISLTKVADGTFKTAHFLDGVFIGSHFQQSAAQTMASQVWGQAVRSLTNPVDITDNASRKVWNATTNPTRTVSGGTVALETATLDAIWDKPLTGILSAGSIGKLVKDNLDAALSTRATAEDVWNYGDGAAVTRTIDSTITVGEVGIAPADITAIIDGVWDKAVPAAPTAGTFGAASKSVLAYTTATTPGAIADAVWDEATASHTTDGTFGTGLGVDALTVADIAAAVWDVDRASHETAGTFGEGIASVQGSITGNVQGSVDSVNTGVTVTANADKGDYVLSAAAIAALWDHALTAVTAAGSIGKLVKDNLNAPVDAVPTAAEIWGYTTRETTGGVVDTVPPFTVLVSAEDKAAIADAVWDEARTGHTGAGSFGEGVASVRGNVTGSLSGSVGSVNAPVTVGTNNDKTGYRLGTGVHTGAVIPNVTSVDTVTGDVSVGTNKDKSNYLLASGTHTGAIIPTVTSVTGDVSVGVNKDKGNYTLSADSVGDIQSGLAATNVDQDYGGTDNLRVLNRNGQAVDGVNITAFLKTDYDANNRTTTFIKGVSETDVDGRWLYGIELVPGVYTLLLDKEGHYGPDTVEIAVVGTTAPGGSTATGQQRVVETVVVGTPQTVTLNVADHRLREGTESLIIAAVGGFWWRPSLVSVSTDNTLITLSAPSGTTFNDGDWIAVRYSSVD